MKDNTVIIDASVIADVIISNIAEMLCSESCNEVDNLKNVIERNLDAMSEALKIDIKKKPIAPLWVAKNSFGGFYGVCPNCYDLVCGIGGRVIKCKKCEQNLKWGVEEWDIEV